jgi:lipid-A-disaccharide synthase
MKDTNTKIIVDSSDLSVVGFFEILRIYPKLIKALNIMKKSILTLKPDLLVLIDYQEFNMKIAKFAKSKGIKVLFYISPQVWAWRENRIKKIKNYIDEMAVIFPFETKYYKKFGVNAVYIGFFPGSRLSEIKKHIPIIKNVIENIRKKQPNEKFLISKSENIDKKIYEKFFYNKDYVKIIENKNIYETIDMCKVALAASGTITLQIALKKVPMCVFYKLSNITYFLVKFLVKTKFVSLVNIILEKKVVNEFIQENAKPEIITDEIEKIINNDDYRKEFHKNYKILEKKLLNDSSKITINDLINQLI